MLGVRGDHIMLVFPAEGGLSIHKRAYIGATVVSMTVIIISTIIILVYYYHYYGVGGAWY